MNNSLYRLNLQLLMLASLRGKRTCYIFLIKLFNIFHLCNSLYSYHKAICTYFKVYEDNLRTDPLYSYLFLSRSANNV